MANGYALISMGPGIGQKRKNARSGGKKLLRSHNRRRKFRDCKLSDQRNYPCKGQRDSSFEVILEKWGLGVGVWVGGGGGGGGGAVLTERKETGTGLSGELKNPSERGRLVEKDNAGKWA